MTEALPASVHASAVAAFNIKVSRISANATMISYSPDISNSPELQDLVTEKPKQEPIEPSKWLRVFALCCRCCRCCFPSQKVVSGLSPSHKYIVANVKSDRLEAPS